MEEARPRRDPRRGVCAKIVPVFLLSIAACAPRREPSWTPASVVAIEPASNEERVDPKAAGAARSAADGAVIKLAMELENIETTCKQQWVDGVVLCGEASFEAVAREVASAYQGHYATRRDPRENAGRIDALPRLGGPDTPFETLRARVERACQERCDTARRLSIADQRGVAVEACLRKTERGACKSLEQHVPRNATLESVRGVVSTCEDECDDRRRALRAREAIERSRPRTQAQSDDCLRGCTRRCPEGGFCGTCEMSCGARCAVR